MRASEYVGHVAQVCEAAATARTFVAAGGSWEATRELWSAAEGCPSYSEWHEQTERKLATALELLLPAEAEGMDRAKMLVDEALESFFELHATIQVRSYAARGEAEAAEKRVTAAERKAEAAERHRGDAAREAAAARGRFGLVLATIWLAASVVPALLTGRVETFAAFGLGAGVVLGLMWAVTSPTLGTASETRAAEERARALRTELEQLRGAARATRAEANRLSEDVRVMADQLDS